MSDKMIVQVQINGSGVDSGEVDYLIDVFALMGLFQNESPSRQNYRRDILKQLDRLKEQVDYYYNEARAAEDKSR